MTERDLARLERQAGWLSPVTLEGEVAALRQRQAHCEAKARRATRRPIMIAPYYEGQRFELVAMPNDPDPVPPGSKGTIVTVTPWPPHEWQITVKWDAGVGRSLALVIPPDVIRILE
jgi:hypothetical protein